MGVGLVSRWPVRRVTRHELPVSHRQVAPVALEAELGHPDASLRVIGAATEWEPAYADDHLAQTTVLAERLADPRQPGPGVSTTCWCAGTTACSSRPCRSSTSRSTGCSRPTTSPSWLTSA